MGLFDRNTKDEKVLSFALGGYKFTSDNQFLRYQSAYGKSFRVNKIDIDSVSLDKGGPGKNIIKINGNGTLLAEVELPKPWAEKAQEFILSEMTPKPTNNPISDLEMLADLKDKGIITQEEFDKKKKQILNL